jgi:hypothetical protein
MLIIRAGGEAGPFGLGGSGVTSIQGRRAAHPYLRFKAS